jgi:hypothetical protein
VLIQRPTEGFTPFRLGDGGTHLGEVVTPDGIPVGAASVTTHVCHPEHASEVIRLSYNMTMAPSWLSSSLSWARSWSCSMAITTEEGTEGLH